MSESQIRKRSKNSEDDDWKQYALRNNQDLESPIRRHRSPRRRNYNYSEDSSSVNTDDFSDEEDEIKNTTFINSASRWLRDTIENWTKLFSYLLHSKLLLNKNYLLATRNRFQITYLMLTPIFLLCLVRWFTQLGNDFTQHSIPNPEVINLDNIEKCTHPTEPCITVAYGIIGEKEDAKGNYNWIHNTMKHLAQDNNLDYGTDVRLVSLGKSYEFKSHFEKHKNTTLFGVLFCTDKWTTKIDVSNSSISKYTDFDDVGFEVPCTMSENQGKMYMYSIMFNYTLIPQGFGSLFDAYKWGTLTRIKTSVDNGILRELHKEKTGSYEGSPKIQNSESRYPVVPDRIHDNADASAILGSFYFFISCLTVFNVIFANMIREKDLQLRIGLHVFGLSSAAHWTAWNLTAIVYSLIPSVIFPIVGRIVGLAVFTKSPFWLIFVIFFFGCYSMAMIAFIVVTIASNEHQGNVISYSVILFSVLMLIILTNTLSIYFLFFNSGSKPWVKYIRHLFMLIPSFNFAILYGQVGRITCNHFDGESLSQIQGREFLWNDLFLNPTGKFHTGDTYLVPSPYELLIQMCYNIVIYWIAVWYLDHIMPNNRGRTHSYLFFLKPSYYFRACKSRTEVHHQKRSRRRSSTDYPEKAGSRETSLRQTVNEEKNQILEDEQQGIECDGLRILGLAMTYKSGTKALKNVYLEARDGELLSILGHNGAGKTTLINILTGQINSTGGDAKICDLRLSKDMESIRKILGLVPQFDILWDNMTAREHLQLFCELKGIKEKIIESTIKSTLMEVNLWNVADNEVRTFSGGMKRRLSVAISGIGDPRIIIMDEPTTGLDPVSRRKVWELIQKIKKDRVVILTTHSMEEADVLSDKIAIIASGRFKCIGTQLSIKHQFGDGYKITIICDPEHSFVIQNVISRHIPECKLLEENAGSLIFMIPVDKIGKSKEFFKLLDQSTQKTPPEIIEESDDCPEVIPSPSTIRRNNVTISSTNGSIDDIKHLIKDCGISHTTLEEVFLKVTKSDKSAGAFIGK